MCGILNVISKSGQELDLSACRRALSSLTMRGPDLCTYKVWENRVFFGQTILSITGDSSYCTDDQLESVTGRFYLAFNGEIYNYHELSSRWLADKMDFVSHGKTDTEVLVNLHEVFPLNEIPSLLDGMYAYSVLDTKERSVSICRDVQGEKSLYIYEDSKLIVVSSEIDAIRFLVPVIKLEPQVFRDYFRTRHFMNFERTTYSGIRQLLPGRLETLDLKTMRWSVSRSQELREWIDPEKMAEYADRTSDSLVDELDSLMAGCIKQMIPDNRKYATIVSGGVDSSLISYYLVKHANPDVLVAVDHVGKDRISKDLSGFERTLGRPINTLKIDQAAYSSEIERCQRACGSPLLSHSFMGQAIQSAFVRASGCRVLFGGEGGDELFGGYPCYLEKRTSDGRFSPSLYTAHNEPKIEFIADDPTAIQNELGEAWRCSLEAYKNIQDRETQVLQAMMYCDAAYQLPSVCLRGADLMSMMWSIEARSVFLRRPIVNFMLNMPALVKSDNREGVDLLVRTKPLLKKLFLRYYPAELLSEKQGFAGFPNESAAYLGNMMDYLALDFLGIRKKSIQERPLDKATAWKLINIEYFLRWN